MKNILSIITFLTLGILACQNPKINDKGITSNNSTSQTDTNDVSINLQDINFGLVNEEGNKVIVFDLENPTLEPNQLKVAYINQTAVTLNYLKKQDYDSTTNGRQTQNLFGQIEGYLYNVEQPIIAKEENEYIVVGSEKFSKSRKLVPTTVKYENITSPTIQHLISSTYRNTISHSKLIASTETKDSIFLIQLKPVKDSLTVLLIVLEATSKNTFVKEFKAEYNGMSTWRVDDGGIFPMEDFKIMNVFKNKDKLEVVTSFPGAEGGSFDYLIPDANKKLIPLRNTYAYWAPW